jgi:hypothetical protein
MKEDEVVAYLGSQCTKFHTDEWMCWFFTPFHLESCIWADTILFWIRQRNSIKFTTNLRKVRRRLWKWLDKTEKSETGEEQSQEHGYHFLWHRGSQKFVLAVQTVNSAYYCDFLIWMSENVRRQPRILATRELAVASCTCSHFLFH